MNRPCMFFMLMLAAAHCLGIGPARAQKVPVLHTNQAYIEDAARASALDINDPMAVFAFVLNSLPDRVKVYPTENYYYFTFIHRGVPYAGNIRLDAADRDSGKVNFGYYEDYARWKPDAPITFRLLGAADGVEVEKVDRFVYRLSLGAKTVLFELNDLSQVKPPAHAIGPDERFIGPMFDESGIRFFLIYNAKLKIFHYVLDETVPVADGFFFAKRTDRIVIGKRTGFAFYRDHRLERKILIGVFLGNAEANNYFDGPFDQLPDNFIEGETLREALIEIDPKLKGQIDRFGAWPGGEQRYMIAPYLMYRSENDLFFIHQCASSKHTPAAQYYACFMNDESQIDRQGSPRHTTKDRKTR
jgi:hypothetical protein